MEISIDRCYAHTALAAIIGILFVATFWGSFVLSKVCAELRDGPLPVTDLRFLRQTAALRRRLGQPTL
jgi:hypothetical protein